MKTGMGEKMNTDPAQQRRDQARAMLTQHWVPEGYAAPNSTVYPWQWLWDSCFHAIVWGALGDHDRAVAELTSALSVQDAMGFVPHMNYVRDPDAHADLWGRSGASSITQPPMFGHAVAELVRLGVEVPDELVERARSGLWFLLTERHRDDVSGLVLLCHPWESGADDSPRWDDMCPGGFEIERWRAHKAALVGTCERAPTGAPLRNPDFPVASVGFNALVAFNVFELATVVDVGGLFDLATALSESLARRFDAELVSWVDAGPTAAGSGRYRTLDAMLPLLVVPESGQLDAGFSALVAPEAYGGPFGPAGVHRGEAMFAPDTYWRGPAWPQLSYLLWVAARRDGRFELAAQIARQTVDGAAVSNWAEYWNPDTGAGLGAIPQSWATLAVVMEGWLDSSDS